MKAETRFPRTVEAYKAHLHEIALITTVFKPFAVSKG